MTKYNYEELAIEIERIAKNAGKIIRNKEELLIEEKTDATNIVTNIFAGCKWSVYTVK